MQLIAVSLIGIPGSGKSTLAREIFEMSRTNLLEAGVVVVTFDNYIRIDYSEFTEGAYKENRGKLLNNIQDLLKSLKKNERIKLEVPERRIDPKLNLVILDDNMYFRSMRQQVRTICRSLNCQHFQIFLRSSLDEAKKRNLERIDPVPEKVIEKMFKNLEVPTNPRTIVVESMKSRDKSFLALIRNRIEYPENLEVSVNPPKFPQLQSLIHEADITTRKLLAAKIKELPKSSGISQVCKKLNRRRQDFLEDLRVSKIEVSDEESLRAAFDCYLTE